MSGGGVRLSIDIAGPPSALKILRIRKDIVLPNSQLKACKSFMRNISIDVKPLNHCERAIPYVQVDATIL